MEAERFVEIFEAQVDQCRSVLVTKAMEYATDDRLHNFKVAAALKGVPLRQALDGMMAKHIVSIFDLCAREESASLTVWDEKITDAMNYLFLLKAVLEEEAIS